MYEDEYAYSRQEVVQELKDLAMENQGQVEFYDLERLLYAEKTTEADLAWIVRTARKHKFVGSWVPWDDRMEQILAMDT